MASALSLCMLGASPAYAEIEPGIYKLTNHVDSIPDAPKHGMRLDELFNVTPDLDIYLFDFEAPGSLVELIFDGSSIRIVGQMLGGLAQDGAFVINQSFGTYHIDITYADASESFFDDDVQVTMDTQNVGTLTAPDGTVIPLVDKQSDDVSFQFGNDFLDGGHRGQPGLSGWGWLMGGDGVEMTHPDQFQDFLFAATFDREIPSPGGILLTLCGALIAFGRRRPDGTISPAR